VTAPGEWLNYNHLYYFWMVAREGTIARAAARLHLTHPTVSAQLKALEDALGERLFTRQGRRLVLTEVGRVVQRYAEEIFSLGGEMVDTVRGRPTGKPERLAIGVADAVPKLLVGMLVEPLRRAGTPVHLVCREDRPERLIAELASHVLDLVVTDAPLPPGAPIRAGTHLLGECGTTFFAPAGLDVPRHRFPRCLDGLPLVLPTWDTASRRDLESWFEAVGVRPRVVAEVEDSALLLTLGRAGWGAFPAPAAVAGAVRAPGKVRVLGTAADVRARFYAFTAERKIRNQAVAAIWDAARDRLFA